VLAAALAPFHSGSFIAQGKLGVHSPQFLQCACGVLRQCSPRDGHVAGGGSISLPRVAFVACGLLHGLQGPSIRAWCDADVVGRSASE